VEDIWIWCDWCNDWMLVSNNPVRGLYFSPDRTRIHPRGKEPPVEVAPEIEAAPQEIQQ